ncbi:MAG: hypothetical protein ABJD07_15205 [Gemmatimonadaceae bacterium]
MQRHHCATVIGFALVALSSAPLRAQGAAGTWIAEFDRGMRNENGVVTSLGKVRARLVLEPRGDSLVGMLTVFEPAENAPPPRPIRGLMTKGALRLEAAPVDAVIRENDEERHVPMKTVYDLTVSADALTGTQHSASLDGAIDGQPRPFSATREKKKP